MQKGQRSVDALRAVAAEGPAPDKVGAAAGAEDEGGSALPSLRSATNREWEVSGAGIAGRGEGGGRGPAATSSTSMRRSLRDGMTEWRRIVVERGGKHTGETGKEFSVVLWVGDA